MRGERLNEKGYPVSWEGHGFDGGRPSQAAVVAGVVGSHVGNALVLLERRGRCYGADAYIENVVRELRAAQGEIAAWQRMAALVTDYDAARAEVESE